MNELISILTEDVKIKFDPKNKMSYFKKKNNYAVCDEKNSTLFVNNLDREFLQYCFNMLKRYVKPFRSTNIGYYLEGEVIQYGKFIRKFNLKVKKMDFMEERVFEEVNEEDVEFDITKIKYDGRVIYSTPYTYVWSDDSGLDWYRIRNALTDTADINNLILIELLKDMHDTDEEINLDKLYGIPTSKESLDIINATLLLGDITMNQLMSLSDMRTLVFSHEDGLKDYLMDTNFGIENERRRKRYLEELKLLKTGSGKSKQLSKRSRGKISIKTIKSNLLESVESTINNSISYETSRWFKLEIQQAISSLTDKNIRGFEHLDKLNNLADQIGFLCSEQNVELTGKNFIKRCPFNLLFTKLKNYKSTIIKVDTIMNMETRDTLTEYSDVSLSLKMNKFENDFEKDLIQANIDEVDETIIPTSQLNLDDDLEFF